MQLIFGIGALWGQRTDVPGVGPTQFGVLQDNTIEFSFEMKELYSQLQFPIDIARGKGKITGKCKFARVFGALYSELFFGSAQSVGETTVSQSEIHTLATTTLGVTNATGFVADLGVYYNNTTNFAFTSTTGALTASGQYSVGAGGVYTFFSGDIGQSIAVSYVYTDSNGQTITINNQFMGYTPTWAGTFYQNHSTQGTPGKLTLRLSSCVSNQLSFPTKIDDYAIPDMNYSAFSLPNGSIGTLSTSE